jgi:hypothetical protein
MACPDQSWQRITSVKMMRPPTFHTFNVPAQIPPAKSE